MQILCLGLSHHTAPVELRERLNYSAQALEAALDRFRGRATRPARATELVILSTCNRLELYATIPDAAVQTDAQPDGLEALFAPLLDFLGETHGLGAADLNDGFYRLTGRAAIEHLGRVAAGLDSMILGEPQILGQVNGAYSVALRQGAAGPVLSALFRAAIHTGKRARAETDISRNAATISSVAVKMAEKVVGPLAARQVLVVGAGEMAELAVEALRKRGASQITVVNRTRTRAVQLAERWGARVLPFEQLGEALAAADIVLTSTDAPQAVITSDLACAALSARPTRPLVLIDIAVPRDVEPDARRLPNTHYFDIDDIEAHLNGALAERLQEVPRVEAIVAEETRAFLGWLGSLEITPLIVGLRAKAEAIRRAEVDKTLRRLPQLGEADRRQIETMTEALVNKLLHEPTLRLKTEAGLRQSSEYAAAARYLFALDD